MNLPTPLAVALEKAIDAVLALDPDTRHRLHGIDGSVLRINVTKPSISVMLSVVQGKVFLASPDDNDVPDVTLSGSLSALRSLLDGNDAVYKGDVSIEGDIGVSQHLKKIFSELDPDWQEAISPYLGDTFTHRLDMAHSRLTDWFRRSRNSFSQNTSDYLQEEVELLAPNSEITHFCLDVDDLRAAADRLDARIKKLEASNVPDTDEA